MKNQLIKTNSAVKTLKPSPTAALEAFNLLIKEYSNYKIVAETEHTKREAIKAWANHNYQQTKAKKEILQAYLTAAFAEREYVIDEIFKRLDEGIKAGNNQLIVAAMTSISDVVKSSPLQDAEKIIQAIHDPNHKRIEF